MKKKVSNQKIIAIKLKEIQNLYKSVLNLDKVKREHLIMDMLLIFSKTINDKRYTALNNSIERLKNKYQDNDFPQDHTLLEILRNENPDFEEIPLDIFEQSMFIYKTINLITENTFDKIEQLTANKSDLFAIKNLRNLVNNTFVNNPNFKASEGNSTPYHKRHPDDFIRSSKLSEEFLDNNFNSWIEYFEETEGDVNDSNKQAMASF